MQKIARNELNLSDVAGGCKASRSQAAATNVTYVTVYLKK